MINFKKRISILILNYNGESLLKKFLPSVIKYSDKKLSDIYIIDNNSSDKSISILISINKDYKKQKKLWICKRI